MKKRYYLFDKEGDLRKVLKDPYKMMNVLGVTEIVHLYKNQYFYIVFNQQMSNIRDVGLLDEFNLAKQYTKISKQHMTAAHNMKDVFEQYIIKRLDEEGLQLIKDQLEKGWRETFNEDNCTDEAIDMVEDMIVEKNIIEDGDENEILFP